MCLNSKHLRVIVQRPTILPRRALLWFGAVCLFVAAGVPPAVGEVAAVSSEPEVRSATRLGERPTVIHGWVEWVELCEPGVRVKAKLDTGARTSSVHAEDVSLFERDGVRWVRFHMVDAEEQRHMREAPLERVARIKRPGGESESRYVVKLALVVGERRLMREFTLNSRPNMIYPVLIGRNALRDLGPVDSGRTFVVSSLGAAAVAPEDDPGEEDEVEDDKDEAAGLDEAAEPEEPVQDEQQPEDDEAGE